MHNLLQLPSSTMEKGPNVTNTSEQNKTEIEAARHDGFQIALNMLSERLQNNIYILMMESALEQDEVKKHDYEQKRKALIHVRIEIAKLKKRSNRWHTSK